MWCRKHGGKAIDIAIYSDDVLGYFNQEMKSSMIGCCLKLKRHGILHL